MRKIVLVGILLSILLTGCASTASLKNAEELSPMSIVSVTSNSEIIWFGEKQKKSGLLDSILKKVVDESDEDDLAVLLSRTKPLLTEAENSLIEALNSVDSVSLVNKEVVLNSNAYLNAKIDKNMEKLEKISPDGYRFVNSKDKKFLKNMNKEIGSSSNVYVDFTFSKKMVTGVGKNGKLGACVEIYVKIVDTKGKIIFQKIYTGISDDSTAIALGVYDPQSLVDLFSSAKSNALDYFMEEFNL